MKFGIVGMGVAGAYLAARLNNEHEVVGFERSPESTHDAVCAWGTCKRHISQLVKPTGLDFENYVMHDGNIMLLDVGSKTIDIGLKGLCTYNKLQLIKDMIKNVKVHYNVNVKEPPMPGTFDYTIDATGMPRPLLPKIKGDVFVPCVQLKVKYRNPPFDDFYIKPFNGLSGYFWYFPLGDGYAHIGAGDYHKRHNEEISAFMNKYPGESLKKVGRPIRLTPPSLCEPFFNGKIVGVGESIGTVYPLVGEGIIPSMECSDIFIRNMNDLESYRKQVLEKFSIYDKIYTLIMTAIRGEFRITSQIFNLLSVFWHMKTHEKRYGLQVRFADILKVAQTYRASAFKPANGNPQNESLIIAK